MMFIDSHIHYIEENSEKYIETILRRMDEYKVSKGILFGIQGHPLCSDGVVRHIYKKYSDRFFIFASSLRCEYERDFKVFIDYLEQEEIWKGVGEIYITPGPYPIVQKYYYKTGERHIFYSYYPIGREKNYIYKKLFIYCGERDFPVLVHCPDVVVMKELLMAFPSTKFIWAHTDWGVNVDDVLSLIKGFKNLYCEIGAQFRFLASNLLKSSRKSKNLEMLVKWREIAKVFYNRIIWGSDIFTWDDITKESYKKFIDVKDLFLDGLSLQAKENISYKNILNLIKS